MDSVMRGRLAGRCTSACGCVACRPTSLLLADRTRPTFVWFPECCRNNRRTVCLKLRGTGCSHHSSLIRCQDDICQVRMQTALSASRRLV